MAEMVSEDTDQEVLRAIQDYVEEATYAKRIRMEDNSRNFDSYHMKQDFSHKRKGQSKEFLPKQSMAVEQISAFMEQGLIDVGQFFKVEPMPGNVAPVFTTDEISKIVLAQLNKNDFPAYVSDSLKLGLLGSLMISKVHGCMVSKSKFVVEDDLKVVGKVNLKKKEDMVWQLKLDLVRQEDFFPDPTGRGLYQIQRIEMDKHELIRLAKKNTKIFNMEAIESLNAMAEGEQDNRKYSETNQQQDMITRSRRKPVIVHELWGTVLDSTGNVLREDVVASSANENQLIRKPSDNPFWHGKSPFVVSPLIRVPKSVWHRALMDAPTALNAIENELYNLMLDAGMMSVHGIRQLREQWLDDPSQVKEGVFAGDTLIVNSSCPPGGKVLERVDSSEVPAEAISVLNLTDKEFQVSALTNDLRLGILPTRAVKATEVVAANQSISGIFSAIARIVESTYIERIIDLAWMNTVQHFHELDRDELIALIGKDRANELLALSPEEIFAGSVNGHKFKVFGISLTLDKQKDFRKLTSLLQTIAGSESLVQAFTEKYSFSKLLGEIVKSLDMNEEKIKIDAASPKDMGEKQDIRQMLMSQIMGGKGAGGAQPGEQSQMPQASAGSANPQPGGEASQLNTGMIPTAGANR
jgi:hypothetical protein